MWNIPNIIFTKGDTNHVYCLWWLCSNRKTKTQHNDNINLYDDLRTWNHNIAYYTLVPKIPIFIYYVDDAYLIYFCNLIVL